LKEEKNVIMKLPFKLEKTLSLPPPHHMYTLEKIFSKNKSN
jgi:hypothetical protein